MNTALYQQKILSLREQAHIRNTWLKERLRTALPVIMQREGFDMWLVIAREYNEDPVIMSLLPEPSMSARRRTILMFTRQPDGTSEQLTISRYGYDGFYESAWDPDEEEQYACLSRLIRERNPNVIGVNTSSLTAFGDGLSHNEYILLMEGLGDEFATRIKSAERLCIGWLEHRILPEIVAYPPIVQLGHTIIAEAFSNQVIHPGVTTTHDVVWWMRQKMLDMGLEAWFQPTIEIQASGQGYNTSEDVRDLIMPGDLLHCDIGFYYLGLATDQQQHAYILRPSETDAPKGLQSALSDANRLQDIHMEEMKVGRTGNEILKATRDRALQEGLDPSIYSHPLGYHGHAAGPTIGLWDRQDGVPGDGDYEIFDNTCYSIELNTKKNVPEWGSQAVRIALEENAMLKNGTIYWLDGRQEKFYLVG